MVLKGNYSSPQKYFTEKLTVLGILVLRWNNYALKFQNTK